MRTTMTRIICIEGGFPCHIAANSIYQLTHGSPLHWLALNKYLSCLEVWDPENGQLSLSWRWHQSGIRAGDVVYKILRQKEAHWLKQTFPSLPSLRHPSQSTLHPHQDIRGVTQSRGTAAAALSNTKTSIQDTYIVREGGREEAILYFLWRVQSPGVYKVYLTKLFYSEWVKYCCDNRIAEECRAFTLPARPGSGLSMCRSVSQWITNNFPALPPRNRFSIGVVWWTVDNFQKEATVISSYCGDVVGVVTVSTSTLSTFICFLQKYEKCEDSCFINRIWDYSLNKEERQNGWEYSQHDLIFKFDQVNLNITDQTSLNTRKYWSQSK